MPQLTDQAGRQVIINSLPKKIVSLVPSQTELLFDLGLEDVVAGITKFCVHPDSWFRSKQRIGGTKNPDLAIIKEIQPDLIIGNKEENRQADIDVLAGLFPVWVTDVNTLGEALEMITDLSNLTGTQSRGNDITQTIAQEFSKLQKHLSQSYRKIKVCYLIWQKPYIAVGSQTFIHSMMEECGIENVFAALKRYPEVNIQQIQQAGCDYILLSSEPYPFTDKHKTEIDLLVPGSNCVLADGELFSWYGSRLMKSPAYFQTLIDKLQDATTATG